MRSKFDEQLRELNDEMIEMGRMIVRSISQAIEALTTQNEELAKKIMESDSDVDHEQKTIENICRRAARCSTWAPALATACWTWSTPSWK